jgi:cholesterol oxidase
MTVHLPVQAVAPDFGVRVIPEDEFVRVMVSDSGGRGSAHCAVVVPIRDCGILTGMNTRFEVPGAGILQGSLPKWSDLFGAGARFLDADGDTERAMADPRPPAESPYFYRLPRDQWPCHDPVLILLCYLQSASIGATVPFTPIRHALRDLAQRKHSADTSPEDRVAAAIAAVLTRPASELRGGLVEGRLPVSDAPAESIVFAVASCHYPSDILDHMPAEDGDCPGPADASLLALGKRMKAPDPPSLLLLAGDQVYTDATGGLFDPKVFDDRFRIPYERRGGSRGAQAVLQRADLDVKTMMDDHEIRDNWEPPDPTDLCDKGKWYYLKFQRSRADSESKRAPGAIAFPFAHKGFRFFMGDTRTEREGRTALNFDRARIMSGTQFGELAQWLAQDADRPRFVLTSTALFPRRLDVGEEPACALLSDAWDGFPRSQHQLLALLCEEQHSGVVFFSGDEHLSSFSTIDIRRLDGSKTCRVYSIHSSALYAPYAFANGSEARFIAEDTFNFPDAEDGPYCCTARTFFPQLGDGFAIVNVGRSSGKWQAKVEFHDAAGIKADGTIAFDLMAERAADPGDR